MSRSYKTDYQFDLFRGPLTAATVEIPPWQSLPAKTRQNLTALMTHLFLQSAAPAGEPEGERHDQ